MQKLSPAAVVIGALRVKVFKIIDTHISFYSCNTVKILYNVTRYNRIFNILHKFAGNGSV